MMVPIQRNFDALATSPRPVLHCAGCGQPLKSYWQPGLLQHLEGHWLVECHNTACHMHMQTLSAEDYAGIIVSRYRKLSDTALTEDQVVARVRALANSAKEQP